jgi:hypothetical protein
MLDQDADVGKLIADPVEAERRWQRAKRLGLSEDREQWAMLDRAGLEGGEDTLATAERKAEIARVRSSDDVLAKRLNGAIAKRPPDRRGSESPRRGDPRGARAGQGRQRH